MTYKEAAGLAKKEADMVRQGGVTTEKDTYAASRDERVRRYILCRRDRLADSGHSVMILLSVLQTTVLEIAF